MFSSIFSCLLVLELVLFSSSGGTDELEELARTNTDAYVIWNITDKYDVLDRNSMNQTCIGKLKEDKELIPFYLVNMTLRDSKQLLLGYSGRYSFRYRFNKLSSTHALYEDRTRCISDQEIYLSTIQRMIVGLSDGEDICISDSFCGCFSRSELNGYRSGLTYFKENTRQFWTYILFGSYIEPTFRIIIVLIGMILNCVLLLIFIREKSIRTESNVLIFNLAISNIFMLLAYIPSNYLEMYEGSEEYYEFIIIDTLSVSANVLTILLLNVQRYFQVCRALGDYVQGCTSKPVNRCITYSAVLWTWSILVAIFLGLLGPWMGRILQVFFYFLVYTFCFSVVLSVYNSLTTRKIHRAAKEGRSITDFDNIPGSGLVLSLTVVYYSTHVPYYIYRVFEMIITSASDIYIAVEFRVVILLLHVAFFSYPCTSVLVLCKASGAFRNLFNKYLFRCWYNPGEGKYVTMSSVRNESEQ